MSGKYSESPNLAPNEEHDYSQMISKSDTATSLDSQIIKLIAEVEKRTAIYAHGKVEYADKSMRARAWKEVCETIIPNWSSLSTETKVIEAKALKNKWRKERDCFMKEYENETGNRTCKDKSKKKRKKSAYYDNLLFLAPYAKTKDQEKIEHELSIAQDATDEENNGDTNVAGTFEFVTTSEYQHSAEKTSNRSNTSSNDEFVNIITVKSDPPLEQDCDKMFLLSLLETFRQVPADKKFSVRMEMEKSIEDALGKKPTKK